MFAFESAESCKRWNFSKVIRPRFSILGRGRLQSRLGWPDGRGELLSAQGYGGIELVHGMARQTLVVDKKPET